MIISRAWAKTGDFSLAMWADFECVENRTFNCALTGVQFIKDCPVEPYIPVYMLIGGVLGAVRMFWALYSQIRSRRPEVLSVPAARPHVSPMKLLSIALSCFLVGWFALGKQEILYGIVSRLYFTPYERSSNFPSDKAAEDLFTCICTYTYARNEYKATLRKHVLHNTPFRDSIIGWVRINL